MKNYTRFALKKTIPLRFHNVAIAPIHLWEPSITPEIAQLAGELRGGFRSQGITRSQADILIAATAKIHQLTLVTRNIWDFEGCEIALLNPFND